MYNMFIVHSWPAFCHAANKRRLIDCCTFCADTPVLWRSAAG